MDADVTWVSLKNGEMGFLVGDYELERNKGELGLPLHMTVAMWLNTPL